tara:strand:+ start:458 stop:823 length:366 start_codon:yes stop_codon:yes gene_type:complete
MRWLKTLLTTQKKNIKKIKPKSVKDIYKSKFQIVKFSNKMETFDSEIKNFLKENMYKNSIVLNEAKKGKKIIKTLFKQIKKNPKKYIKKNFYFNNSNERAICDFIAGMTDRYAIKLYGSTE